MVDIFRDRQHAGEMLANLLKEEVNEETLILRILAGGIPVAREAVRGAD